MEADLANQAASEKRGRLDQELKEEEVQRTAVLRRSRLQAEVAEQEADKIAN